MPEGLVKLCLLDKAAIIDVGLVFRERKMFGNRACFNSCLKVQVCGSYFCAFVGWYCILYPQTPRSMCILDISKCCFLRHMRDEARLRGHTGDTPGDT